MLLLSIGAIASGVSVTQTINQDMKVYTPVDGTIQFYDYQNSETDLNIFLKLQGIQPEDCFSKVESIHSIASNDMKLTDLWPYMDPVSYTHLFNALPQFSDESDFIHRRHINRFAFRILQTKRMQRGSGGQHEYPCLLLDRMDAFIENLLPGEDGKTQFQIRILKGIFLSLIHI